MKTIASLLATAASQPEYFVGLKGSQVIHPQDLMELYRLIGEYGGRNVNDTTSPSEEPRFSFPTPELAQQFEAEVTRLWPSIQTENSWRTTHASTDRPLHIGDRVIVSQEVSVTDESNARLSLVPTGNEEDELEVRGIQPWAAVLKADDGSRYWVSPEYLRTHFTLVSAADDLTI